MSELAIKVSNVKKTLGKRNVLNGVSFEVEQGDIFGFLGPNGAGKTTTIRTVMGLYYPDDGEINILGGSPDDDNIRRQVGFVLDRDGLYDSLSAADNLACFLRLYGLKDDKKTIMKALETVGLENRKDDKVGSFSKGMRQRVAIARSIVHSPKVIILDEPTSGVDPTEQMNLRKFLVDIAKSGTTVFLSTHNMDEVQKICNKIAILNKGIIQVTGSLDSIEKQYGKNCVTVIVDSDLTDEKLEQLKKDEALGFYTQNGNRLIFNPKEQTMNCSIITKLTNMGVIIEELRSDEISLEDMYATVIKESDKDE